MAKNQILKVHLDHIGFSVSLLCAIHCGILPFILALAPLANLKFLQDPWLENIIIIISLFIAGLSLIHGYRRHHGKLNAIGVVLTGFLLIYLGHTLTFNWAEILFTSMGATLVALAHFINWRLVRRAQIGEKKVD